MCLEASRHATYRLRKKMRSTKNKWMCFYKVCRIDNDSYSGELRTPYQDWPVNPGQFISDRESIKLSPKNGDALISGSWTALWQISRGIHVFLSFEDAKYGVTGYNYTVLPVWAKVDDLVAAGRFNNKSYEPCDSAVFMKVSVRQKDYNKALGK